MSQGSKPPARRNTPKPVARLRSELLNTFVDSGMADLSRGEFAVWLSLHRDTKRDGTARSSLGEIARQAAWIAKRQAEQSAVLLAGECSRCSAK